MKRFNIVLVAAMLLVASIAFAQTPYSQDFENLAMVDGSLAADGWLVYGNIFDPAGNYLWGHGPWAAPNNIGNWQDIVDGQGGAEQGLQQLSVYSDYGNAEHGNGNLVESNLFQEQILPVGCTGTWIFEFDAKMGNLVAPSTALAFIKTLDPNAGWTLSNFITVDMTAIPTTWGTYMLSIDVAGLDGQYLQIGFSNTCTNYDSCGIFYDNVDFYLDGSAPVEESTWGGIKAMYR